MVPAVNDIALLLLAYGVLICKTLWLNQQQASVSAGFHAHAHMRLQGVCAMSPRLLACWPGTCFSISAMESSHAICCINAAAGRWTSAGPSSPPSCRLRSTAPATAPPRSDPAPCPPRRMPRWPGAEPGRRPSAAPMSRRLQQQQHARGYDEVPRCMRADGHA